MLYNVYIISMFLKGPTNHICFELRLAVGGEKNPFSHPRLKLMKCQ